jgi:hypothetical protein
MIRPVDSSLASDAIQQTGASTQATTPTTAFAKALEKETVKNGTTVTAARISPPEGETWKPVKGEDGYVEIISGPRKGQYVDLAKGDHRGDTFRIEQREGKLVRVYGESGSEEVVDIKKSAAAAKDAKDAKKSHSAPEIKPPKGETWAPVEGHWNYADILNGKRNGYFVNLSSGVRRGQVFLIEHHNGKTFHVYGQGKDRTVVEVNAHKKAQSGAQSSTPASSTQGTSQPTGTTGGTSASK